MNNENYLNETVKKNEGIIGEEEQLRVGWGGGISLSRGSSNKSKKILGYDKLCV